MAGRLVRPLLQHGRMAGPLSGDFAIDVVVLAKALRRLQERLVRLATRLSDACDDVDAAAKATEELVRRLSAASGVAPRRRAARSPADEQLMRAEEDAGASSLQVLRRADGSGEVSVSGRRSFRLSPKLAILLAMLVLPGGETHAGRPGWRTVTEVAILLNKQTGGALAPRAVPKLVYKLRGAFRDAGENWHLIQTSRDWGVRVAVRR